MAHPQVSIPEPVAAPLIEIRDLSNHAHQQLLRGALQLADAVRPTLGPRSRRILLEVNQSVILSDDGVTIARKFKLQDPEQDLGARLVREAAERAVAIVGDGTTTSIVLTAAILAAAMPQIDEGASALEVKQGLDEALEVALGCIRGLSRKPDETQRQQVARISGHHDVTTGAIVAKVLGRIGVNGFVSVETQSDSGMTVDVREGLQLDSGYRSPYLLPSVKSGRVVLKDSLVLISEETVTARAVDRLLKSLARSRRPLLIVAASINDEAVEKLVAHAARSRASHVAVELPRNGAHTRAILEDIAVRTGGRVISPHLGIRLSRLRQKDLGQARRIEIDATSTVISGGGGDREAIDGRVAEIQTRIQATQSESERRALAQRLAGLRGGTAFVKIGGRSPAEVSSRLEAFDDALNATRAAMAEGVVPGGGLMLLRSIDAVSRAAEAATGDARAGMLVLKSALEAPTRQIAENAGANPDEIVGRVRRGTGAVGFDARSGRCVDLMQAGVIDPTKVVCLALETAVSVAGMMLLSESILAPSGIGDRLGSIRRMPRPARPRTAIAPLPPEPPRAVEPAPPQPVVPPQPVLAKPEPPPPKAPPAVVLPKVIEPEVMELVSPQSNSGEWFEDKLAELETMFDGPAGHVAVDESTMADFARDMAKFRHHNRHTPAVG